MDLTNLVQRIPKAELHLHIEGTLEPEMMMTLAQRNQIELPYDSVDEIRDAYNFSNLQSFLDIYSAGAQVLREKQDFYELTWAYLNRAAKDNVRHVEIFFDPQIHTERDVAFAAVVDGQIPLTVCPLSNVKLRVFDTLEQHNLKQLLRAGLCTTINSDDPAYFGGYIGENYLHTQQALNLSEADIHALTKNAFIASFLTDVDKQRHIAELDRAMSSL